MKARMIGPIVAIGLAGSIVAQTPDGAVTSNAPGTCAAIGDEINALSASRQRVELESAQKASKPKPTALGGLGGGLLMRSLSSGGKKEERARQDHAAATQARIETLTAQYAQKNC